MGLPFLAVAAQSSPALSEGQKQSLKLIAEEILKKQQPDGSWEFFATLRRPPINESQTTDAAWIIMALQGETGPDAPEAQRAALSKAMAWLVVVPAVFSKMPLPLAGRLAPSSRGLGHGPFKAATRVRIPSGSASD